MLQIANAFFKLQVICIVIGPALEDALSDLFIHLFHPTPPLLPITLDRPGHYLSPGEDEALGLKRRLDIQLTSDINESTLPPGISASGAGGMDLGGGDWEVGDCLGTWWRPNYETYMVSGACAR